MPIDSEHQRLALRIEDLTVELDLARHRLAKAYAHLQERLTPRQCRQILDRNQELERMNAVLLRRNEILNRRLNEKPSKRLVA